MVIFEVLDELKVVGGSTELHKQHVLMAEMEALGRHEVASDSLECLKETQARETNMLAALTKILIEARL
nr:hypothetical protein [Tanacetum cinerariifolium]